MVLGRWTKRGGDVDLQDVAEALVGRAVTAAATAFGGWRREAIACRSEAFRRRKARTNATQEVQFVQAWIAASRELDPDGARNWARDQIRTDLERAYAVVAAARVVETALDQKRPSLKEMAKSVLLRGMLRSPWARAGLV